MTEVQVHEVDVGGKNYKVTLTPDQESGGFTAESPDVHGAISSGETEEEALGNIKEAILLVLEDIRENGE